MNTLSERVKKALSESGKTQADLARACGITPVSVNNWVSGKTKSLKMETGVPAAAFLRVNPIWLTKGKGPMRPSESPNSEPTPNKGERRTKGASEALFQDLNSPNVLHHLPVITWEMDMEEMLGIGRWRADDDYITRELHAPKSWWVIVDTRVQFAPGDIVLIRAERESMALRRVVGKPGDLHLVTLSGADAPTPTDGSEIIGVACGSFKEMEARIP